jgi:hypothetical protein
VLSCSCCIILSYISFLFHIGKVRIDIWD